jgi:hypothetical protein
MKTFFSPSFRAAGFSECAPTLSRRVRGGSKRSEPKSLSATRVPTRSDGWGEVFAEIPTYPKGWLTIFVCFRAGGVGKFTHEAEPRASARVCAAGADSRAGAPATHASRKMNLVSEKLDSDKGAADDNERRPKFSARGARGMVVAFYNFSHLRGDVGVPVVEIRAINIASFFSFTHLFAIFPG